MNCNIIKDLLPSYVDGICSEETMQLVEGHIQQCKACSKCLNTMKQQPVFGQPMPEEVEKAITPFKKINRKHRIQVFAAIAITFMMTIIGAFVVQEVGAVSQFLFPRAMGIVEVKSDMKEWEELEFNDQNDLTFDSIFWDKEIVNDASNESDVLLRVKDGSGNVVIDEVHVPAGESVKLDELERNKQYFFEIKAPQGRFLISAT